MLTPELGYIYEKRRLTDTDTRRSASNHTRDKRVWAIYRGIMLPCLHTLRIHFNCAYGLDANLAKFNKDLKESKPKRTQRPNSNMTQHSISTKEILLYETVYT